MSSPSATAVVVAYGAEPELESCVAAILASIEISVDVVIVDNGDTSGSVDRLASTPGVRVLRPGRNTGFAEGCNLGAEQASSDVVVLINPDVVVEPLAIARLASVAMEPGVGIATSSLRLADKFDCMNSAGNPVHFLGVAWAGGHGDLAALHTTRTRVTSASGACCAVRRALWDELGGFEPAYFAYHEDVELSLRCWQRGLEVIFVPDAVATHHYEFSRNAVKSYLLERNRWLTILTLYATRTLLLLAPVLLLQEMLILVTATVQGWLPAKLSGYRWLVKKRALVSARRTCMQRERIRSDRDLAALFATRIEPTNVDAPPGLGVLNSGLAAYWWLVRHALR